MSPISIPPDYLHALDRYRFLMILTAAKKCEEYQFIKKASLFWLVNFPGDLYVKYHQALSQAHLGKQKEAVAQLEELIDYDPLFIEPVWELVEICRSQEKQRHYQEIYAYLREKKQPEQISEAWLVPLWKARQAYSVGEFEKANTWVHQSLVADPPSPIPAILHLKTASKLENQEMLNNLSEIYHSRWPNNLQINIIKALTEMEQGKESSAVERLHWVAAHDIAGQVIQRLMGSDHRFCDLYPERMELYFDLPIPASVTARLGWNRLGTGQVNTLEFKQTPNHTPSDERSATEVTRKIIIASENEEISKEADGLIPEPDEVPCVKELPETEIDTQDIQETFTRLAKRLKKPELERVESRFPVYVILSSKQLLQSVYGPNTLEIIDESLNKLVGLIQQLPDWGATLFYPDDPLQMAKLGLKPSSTTDAWQIKLALKDLDQVLEKRGEMIGALLIVGGPEIIPYHHLPNPTFDDDLDVPSDNPYATIDENYFIPQWPVGRLPGETGPDAGLLLSQIRHLVYQYEKKSKKEKSFGNNLASLINWVMQLLSGLSRGVEQRSNLGYSAEIWKEASAGVYKTVGKQSDLKLSPPLHAHTLKLNHANGHKLGYFNLHGIKDGPHWYGQKDFSSASNGPDYPIALSPSMFSEHIRSPKLVFTEACYGANIQQKHHEDALSLKFLDSGTISFVGSTCIAYGSVMPPLIAADYLAEMFWRKVREGKPAGYALMQAKLSLAEEMIRLQGFLDGEDQKTILSFVLFGDPLAVHTGIKSMPKPLFRTKSHPGVKTISDSQLEPNIDNARLPDDLSKNVKKAVAKYLPGLQNAQMRYNKSINFEADPKSKTRKGDRSANSERYFVTLQKSFDQNQHTTHHHYARMTFDKKGKLIKFTTSR